MDFYLGQIQLYAFGYATIDWLACNGQLLPISQYDALYSLIGTKFGGDGVTTFALPNLNNSPVMPKVQGFMLYYICINGLYPTQP